MAEENKGAGARALDLGVRTRAKPTEEEVDRALGAVGDDPAPAAGTNAAGPIAEEWVVDPPPAAAQWRVQVNVRMSVAMKEEIRMLAFQQRRSQGEVLEDAWNHFRETKLRGPRVGKAGV